MSLGGVLWAHEPRCRPRASVCIERRRSGPRCADALTGIVNDRNDSGNARKRCIGALRPVAMFLFNRNEQHDAEQHDHTEHEQVGYNECSPRRHLRFSELTAAPNRPCHRGNDDDGGEPFTARCTAPSPVLLAGQQHKLRPTESAPVSLTHLRIAAANS